VTGTIFESLGTYDPVLRSVVNTANSFMKAIQILSSTSAVGQVGPEGTGRPQEQCLVMIVVVAEEEDRRREVN